MDIEEDQQTLIRIMAGVDVSPRRPETRILLIRKGPEESWADSS